MKLINHGSRFGYRRQSGATAVEFALVSTVFFMLIFGMMELGRMVYFWTSAVEATRFGARMAVVCDVGDSAIKTRIQQRLSILPIDHIAVIYAPSGCTVDTCESVTVSILPGVSVATYIPFVPLSLSLPAFSTTLPRESMQSMVDGGASPVCG